MTLGQAASLFGECISLAWTISDHWSIALVMPALADTCAATGDLVRATRYHAAGLALGLVVAARNGADRALLYAQIGEGIAIRAETAAAPETVYTQPIARLRLQLGEERFRQAWPAGQDPDGRPDRGGDRRLVE